MRVDPLEAEHDVESELADLDALGPAGSCPSKVFVGGTQFELPKNFLFPEELAGSARNLGHEHGRRPCIAGQPFNQFADLVTLGFREADATFDALGGKRHQALFDDIAGMLEVGCEC